MRKRNIRIQFWLNKKEAEVLHKRVKRSGLSRGSVSSSFGKRIHPQGCTAAGLLCHDAGIAEGRSQFRADCQGSPFEQCD